MLSATFDRQVTLHSQAELQSRFGSDRVYLADGASVALDGDIRLGLDVQFAGRCQVSGPAQVETGSMLTDVMLGRGNTVRAYSILSDLEAGERNLFGPFCFIRNGCRVANDCILGAHVETTRSRFGAGVKISHRAFVGDAELGERVIIGAGVVFCNFDGQGRQATLIGDDVTVGSGSLLVPPIKIGANAIIAAGSTITKNVAPSARIIQKR